MGKMEEIEMERYRNEIHADMRTLMEKYRAIFEWDIPDVDQNAIDKMILLEMRTTLEVLEKNFSPQK